MSLNITEKKAVVKGVNEVAQKANAVVAANYLGLTAEQMTGLRAKARSQGVHLQVVKNSLAKRALAGTAFENCEERLTGPLILAFSTEEASASARIFKDFIKENENKEDMVQFLWFDGNVLDASDLNKIASLPTKDEAISMFMAVIKEPVAKLVRTIDAVRVQKEESA